MAAPIAATSCQNSVMQTSQKKNASRNSSRSRVTGSTAACIPAYSATVVDATPMVAAMPTTIAHRDRSSGRSMVGGASVASSPPQVAIGSGGIRA